MITADWTGSGQLALARQESAVWVSPLDLLSLQPGDNGFTPNTADIQISVLHRMYHQARQELCSSQEAHDMPDVYETIQPV